eukprot:gene18797-37868_t
MKRRRVRRNTKYPGVAQARLSLLPVYSALPRAEAQHALHAFETVVGSTSGFRRRPGQHQMAETVAATLAQADIGEHPNPTKAIAHIQRNLEWRKTKDID